MDILEIKNVAYSYANSKEKVLSGVNQKFELGKFYAIVGKSGAGKSTLPASYFNYGMVWNELCLYAGAEVAIRLSVGDYCFSYYRNRRNHLLQKEKILLIFPT